MNPVREVAPLRTHITVAHPNVLSFYFGEKIFKWCNNSSAKQLYESKMRAGCCAVVARSDALWVMFLQEATKHKKLLPHWRNLLIIFLVWKGREHLEGQRLLSENVRWSKGGILTLWKKRKKNKRRLADTQNRRHVKPCTSYFPNVYVLYSRSTINVILCIFGSRIVKSRCCQGFISLSKNIYLKKKKKSIFSLVH